MKRTAETSDAVAIASMRAAMDGGVRWREPFNASSCPQMRALCDGAFQNAGELCAALASDEGWGDASLRLYRRHAVAGCLLKHINARDVDLIYVIRVFKAVGGGCRHPLHRWVFDSVSTGLAVKSALDDVAVAIDDFRSASIRIWYGGDEAVDEEVSAAVAQLVVYCDAVREDCHRVCSNERLRNRKAFKTDHLSLAPSLGVVARAYLHLLEDFDRTMAMLKTLMPKEFMVRYAAGQGRRHLNADFARVEREIAKKRAAIQQHAIVPSATAD
ncbi:hypothetical protein JKP88DRAFT_284575 [Tribonema minus]|uniref:Uncharacterized protein n=1 Tax=Tribonema minus TaxID=303371 RepID=A0A835ZP65_9STRA|nr:hypothetical protein JKP88DRAFT_284575 [Tribonema minus]